MQLIKEPNSNVIGINDTLYTVEESDLIVSLTPDEWHAIRYAVLMLADVTGNAPLMPNAGVTRSDAMKGRRRAFRLRDEVARISNSLGLAEL